MSDSVVGEVQEPQLDKAGDGRWQARQEVGGQVEVGQGGGHRGQALWGQGDETRGG